MSTWTVVKELREGEIAITISATNTWRPQYSLSIWKINGEQIYRYFPLHFAGKGKVESAKPSMGAQIAKLYCEAEQWCLEQAQKREDEIIGELEAKEKAQLERQKPAKRGGTHS